MAIVHNLHRRIEATRTRLRAAIKAIPAAARPEIIEITGRLDSRRRAAAEERLRTLFGRSGSRAPANGVVVIGTQVLEESLDLDFDDLATDPAPIDRLLQRAGRLHRFRSIEARNPATLHIVGVVDAKAGPSWPPYTASIYQQAVLLRTWAVVRDRTALCLPADGPPLVDAVYGADDEVSCPSGWASRWRKANTQMQRVRNQDRRRAANLYLPPPIAEDSLLKMTMDPKFRGQTRKPDGR